MEDAVKLIIELSKEDYEYYHKLEGNLCVIDRQAIINGTLLDDVKSEIMALRYGSDTYKNAIDDVIDILDNTVKPGSEET